MKVLSALGRRLGESIARFEPTRVSLDRSFERLDAPPTFRVSNGVFTPASLSPNLLFDIPSPDSVQTVEIRLKHPPIINLQVRFDVEASDDLLGMLAPTTVSKDLSLSRFNQFNETRISENLFRPLLPHGVNGKSYQKRVESQPAIFGSVDKFEGYVKAYSRKKSTGGSSSYQTQSLTIWDLLLPILMPPVKTDFGQQFELFQSLFKFQPAGIEFLVKNSSALLSDEMGTGKTVMSVVALKLLFRLGKAQKALIVCPVSLLRTWQDHLQDWAKELQLTVVRGNPDVRRLDWKYPAHVYLTTYDTVASDFLDSSENPGSFDLVLIDEAQYIKNRTSKRARAIRLFNPKYRWALTGTPMENRLEDLVSIFSFIKPDLFRREYNLTPHHASNLIKPHFLRRMKKDVMKDLPPKVRQEMWLELDAEQRRAYDEVESQGKYKIENLEVVTKVHIFALITALKQICNFAPGKGKSRKTEELIDLVEQIKESGQKVLVFSQYDVEGVSKLERVLGPYGVSVLKGGLNDRDRNNAINEFKRNKDTCVFLATIKTGGVGLTLTEASYVIHFDHWWNPALMWQADDRVHRSGQKSSQVNIYSFWMQNTIEERIHAILNHKKLLFDEVINNLSETDIEDMISTEEWLKILGISPKGKVQK